MKVSIIIPAYNAEKYIKKCLDSLLKQTLKDFEVIIIDDCSTDRTMEFVKAYRDDRIYLYKNETNKGPSFSRNRAIRIAKGDYIAILDSDDWWTKDRLQIMIQFMEKNGADMVFDNILYIRENEQYPWQTFFQHKDIIVREPFRVTPDFFVQKDLGILKAIIRRDVLTENDIFYDEAIKYSEDFMFYLQISLKTNKVWLLPEGYYYYLTREGSLVTNMFALSKQIIQTTDDLIKEKRFELSPSLKNCLLMRQKQFRVIASYYDMEQLLNQKKIWKACLMMATYPTLIKMAIMIRLRNLKTKLMKRIEAPQRI